jgi:AraC-like DNA-binding protein
MLNLMDYTISERVAEIFNLYTKLHDIRISLFSPEGRLIYPDSVGRPNCNHCIMLRETLEMDSACRSLDRKMMQTSLDRRSMVTYTCHAGMREAAAPVFVEDELAGYVMLGQFRSEAAPGRSPYAEQWEVEQGNSELQRAYEETAVFPEYKIKTLLSMFQHLMQFIMESHLIRHKDYDLLEPVIQRIHRRPEAAFSLIEAARLAGLSPSTLTRMFKKVTGHSFKQYQTLYRMEQAAHLLQSMPSRPVGEIAQVLGYADPLYFSRAFRRYHGCGPSAFRSRSRQ